MIIVSLTGGLGNQLFQYALGRALSIRHQVELLLDISAFETYHLHRYSLQHFRIFENFVPAHVERRLFRHLARRRLGACAFHLRRYLAPSRYPLPVFERGTRFDPTVLQRSPPVHLTGYWQSEQYFSFAESELRTELTVRTPASGRDHDLLQMMAETESISLHVRRGDYATNPHTLAVHGTCSVDYYERALQRVCSACTQPHVFVFSDDHEWCRSHLKTGIPTTYVDHNDARRNYEDLRLMSSCRHNIIANSTFSWWGAWLNPHPDRIVVAPLQWFQTAERDDSDLIPQNWIRM